MTSISTVTCRTPATVMAAAVTSSVIFWRRGQPETVRKISTCTVPFSPTDTFLTMPRSVIGLWISGSCTLASDARTASTSGVVTQPCYGPVP
jgi:hypothetical protein